MPRKRRIIRIMASLHYKCICRLKMGNLNDAATSNFLCMRTIAFPFVTFFFLLPLLFEKNRDRKSGSQEKIQLQLRIRMVKGAREKLCMNVECSIACDVYIMAFYSAGKIDSMIEQFSFFSLHPTHIRRFFYEALACVCVCVCVCVSECELEI